MYPDLKCHVFVCQNQRPEGHPLGCCLSKGSDKILTYMKARVKELAFEKVRINKAGCLGACEEGPAVVVYPNGEWYTVKSVEEAEQVVQKIKKFCKVEGHTSINDPKTYTNFQK